MCVVAGGGFLLVGREARGLRDARGGERRGSHSGAAATGGRRAVERRPGFPTGSARGRARLEALAARSRGAG